MGFLVGALTMAAGVVVPTPAVAAIGHPFGSHTGVYAPDTLFPSIAQSTKDAVVRNYYFNRWKPNFIRAGCGTGRYYVRSPDAGTLNVAEGQGYAWSSAP